MSRIENDSLGIFLSEICINKKVLMIGDFYLLVIKWDGTRTGIVLRSRASFTGRSFCKIFLEIWLTQLVVWVDNHYVKYDTGLYFGFKYWNSVWRGNIT